MVFLSHSPRNTSCYCVVIVSRPSGQRSSWYFQFKFKTTGNFFFTSLPLLYVSNSGCKDRGNARIRVSIITHLLYSTLHWNSLRIVVLRWGYWKQLYLHMLFPFSPHLKKSCMCITGLCGRYVLCALCCSHLTSSVHVAGNGFMLLLMQHLIMWGAKAVLWVAGVLLESSCASVVVDVCFLCSGVCLSGYKNPGPAVFISWVSWAC